MTFEHRRQILLRQMLLHTCVGHPVAAWLSRFGFRNAAERVHYVTLPKRTRRRQTFERVKFQHDTRLLSMDALWVPLASIFAAFGFYNAAHRIWFNGPVGDAIHLGACGYLALCECKCGCDGHTYVYGWLCYGCRSDKHEDMSTAELLKIKEKRRRIKEIEDE